MALAVSGGGKMIVNSGTYSSEPTAAAEGNNQGSSHGSWVAGVMNSGGTLIINGGTFSNGNYGDDSLATAARGLIFADTKAVVEVNGGVFKALKSIFDFQNNLGGVSPVFTIKGGEYSANPCKVTSYGSVTIANGYKVVENADGTFSVASVLGKVGIIRNIEVTNDAGEARYQAIFLCGIDALNYKKVGFEVTVAGKTRTIETKTVFLGYTAAGIDYLPSAFGAACEYIFAIAINFPTDLAGEAIVVRPYYEDFDGNVVYGNESSWDYIYNK
jgi:hypothetical protein